MQNAIMRSLFLFAIGACVLLACSPSALAARKARLTELEREALEAAARVGGRRRLQQTIWDLLESLDLNEPVETLWGQEYPAVDIFDSNYDSTIGYGGGYGFYGYYGYYLGVYGTYGTYDMDFLAHDFYWTKDEVTGELTLNDDGTVDEVLKLDIPGVDLDESDFELLGALGRRRLQSLVLEELLQKGLLNDDPPGTLDKLKPGEAGTEDYPWVEEDEASYLGVVDYNPAYPGLGYYGLYWGHAYGYYYGSAPVYGTYGFKDFSEFDAMRELAKELLDDAVNQAALDDLYDSIDTDDPELKKKPWNPYK